MRSPTATATENENQIHRFSKRRSTIVRRGKGSQKSAAPYGAGSALQLDAIQRGQRVLDARMQVLALASCSHVTNCFTNAIGLVVTTGVYLLHQNISTAVNC